MVIICEVINVKDFLVNDLVRDEVTVIWNEENVEDVSLNANVGIKFSKRNKVNKQFIK